MLTCHRSWPEAPEPPSLLPHNGPSRSRNAPTQVATTPNLQLQLSSRFCRAGDTRGKRLPDAGRCGPRACLSAAAPAPCTASARPAHPQSPPNPGQGPCPCVTPAAPGTCAAGAGPAPTPRRRAPRRQPPATPGLTPGRRPAAAPARTPRTPMAPSPPPAPSAAAQQAEARGSASASSITHGLTFFVSHPLVCPGISLGNVHLYMDRCNHLHPHPVTWSQGIERLDRLMGLKTGASNSAEHTARRGRPWTGASRALCAPAAAHRRCNRVRQ